MNGVNHVSQIEPITVEQIKWISMNIHECLSKVTRILSANHGWPFIYTGWPIHLLSTSDLDTVRINISG